MYTAAAVGAESAVDTAVVDAADVDTAVADTVDVAAVDARSSLSAGPSGPGCIAWIPREA